MARLTKKRIKKAGLSPGTLIHVGERKTESIGITVIEYDEENYREKQVKSLAECLPIKSAPSKTWINIDGLHEVKLVEELGAGFNLHPLLLEDILNTNQMPKVDDYENYLFVVLKVLDFDETAGKVQTEQISLVLGENYVISFREKQGNIIAPVQERMKNAKGRLRRLGSDYLLYALIDSVVDHYFIVLDKLAERIETLQERVATEPTEETLTEIHELKREMIILRKSVWPLREIINVLARGESELIKQATAVYIRDVYDHAVQVLDLTETYREMIAGMLDIYLSSISNKMNAVMKVLTIIATIFIPLTFIAGVYGMNFKHMPELEWYWSYPLIWVVMVAVVTIMVIYFRKNKWL
jgi:magnesium transporter